LSALVANKGTTFQQNLYKFRTISSLKTYTVKKLTLTLYFRDTGFVR